VKGALLEEELDELLSIDPSTVAKRAKTMYDEIGGKFAKSVVLFGSGLLGRRTLAGLRSIGIEPLAFADNNPDLWNLSVDGLIVLPPEVAAQKFGDKAVFVVTIYNGAKVRLQLKAMQCLMVVPFAYLYWKYSETLMPHGALDLPHSIYGETEEIRKVFSLWADDTSRREYLAQLRWRLLLDFDCLPSQSPAEETYFPKDLISLSDDEVFVDCGAYDGDTVRTFLRIKRTKFKTIIPIEPDPENFNRLIAFVSHLPADIRNKIIPKQLATASSEGELCFQAEGTMASSADSRSDARVKCAALDEIVSDYKPTYIKMDIEGAEHDTLKGARNIIKRNSTGWAVCLYHRQHDLWRIPFFINSLSSGYRFFLRRHAEECWELICYAVPLHRFSAFGAGEVEHSWE